MESYRRARWTITLLLIAALIGPLVLLIHELGRDHTRSPTIAGAVAITVLLLLVIGLNIYASAEDGLRKTQEREREFRDMIQRVPAVVYTAGFGADARWHYVSPQIERLLGYAAEEWVADSQLWFSLVHPDDRETVLRLEERSGATGEKIDVEYRVLGRDGSWHWIRDEATVVDDARLGRVFKGLLTDITDRKDALTRLQDSEQRLRTMIDTEPECVKLIDLEGNLIHMNPAGLAMLDLSSADDLEGCAVEVFVAAEHREAFGQMNATALGGEQSSLQFDILGASGTRRHVESYASPFRDATGAVTGVLAITRDITDRVKLEQDLRRAQKLEAIGQLAGGIAHDFNNILAIILNYAEELRNSIDGSQGTLGSDLDEIRKAAGKGVGLVSRLTAFSRRDAGVPQILTLNDPIMDIGKMLRKAAGDAIEVRVSLADNLWTTRMDPSNVDQVVMNLVLNARDAMPDGGTISLRTQNVVVDDGLKAMYPWMTGEEYVLLSVADTGSGIPEEIRDKVFDPFFTTKRDDGGTGLGLATVYAVAREAGGQAVFSSRIGVGTTFELYLPRVTSSTFHEGGPMVLSKGDGR